MERVQQQHIVRDGDTFTFGKSVEKNGQVWTSDSYPGSMAYSNGIQNMQLYYPPTVSVKFVYNDVLPGEDVETAVNDNARL